jgi:hypothetical protein
LCEAASPNLNATRTTGANLAEIIGILAVMIFGLRLIFRQKPAILLANPPSIQQAE